MKATFRRGVALAACSLLGCFSETPEQTSTNGAAVTATPDETLLEQTRARFQLHFERPAKTADNDLSTDEVPPSPQKLTAPAIPPAEALGATESANLFSPRWAPSVRVSAIAKMPSFSDGAIRLARSTAALEIKMLQTAHARASSVGGYLLYRGAVNGQHAIVRPTPDGLEDYVVFDAAPSSPLVEYDVTLQSGVAGLRLVSGVLEFLDAQGDPRLRVAPPSLVDSTGHLTRANLSVEGCAVDTNPAAPWGRKTLPPRAGTCRLRVAWSNEGISYPALLDPAWTSTGSMIEGRGDFTATTLANGYVLIAGGHGSAPTVGAELYNPATGTFASTGAPVTRRDDHVAILLQSGKVLIAGGEQTGVWTPLKTAELYNPATGTFSNTGAMRNTRREFAVEQLANGRVYAFGGWGGGTAYRATSEYYDPTTATWTNGPSMSTARGGLKSATLTNSKILLTGGFNGTSYLATTELYDPAANTFSAGPTMSSARRYHAQVALPYVSDVLLSGGMSGTTTTATSVELYDGATNAFLPAGVLSQERMKHSAVLLDGSTVLFAGGQDHTTTCVNGTDVSGAFSPSTVNGTSMTYPRSNFAAVSLGSKALVMGGYDGAIYRTSAELYDPSGTTSSAIYDSASPAKAVVTWDTPGLTGTFAPSTNLVGTVQNNTSASASVKVDIVASGLDARVVARNITTLSVSPYSTASVSVSLSTIPVQSIGSETTFWLRAQPLDAFGAPAGAEQAGESMSAEWSSSYSSVILHGTLGLDLDRTQPSPSTTGAAWRSTTHATLHALATPVGRVWNGSSFVDVTTLPPNGNASAEYAMRGQWATDFHDLGPSFTTDYVPTGDIASYVLCLDWRSIFTDNYVGGDDYLTSSVNPAAYAFAVLQTDATTPQVVFSGNLSATGCTPTLSLGKSDAFHLIAVTDLTKPFSGGTEIVVTYYKGTPGPPFPNASLAPLVVAESWKPGASSGGLPLSPDTIRITTAAEDRATRVAAALGQVMKSDLGIPSGKHVNAFASTGCPDIVDINGTPVESCASPSGSEFFVGAVLNDTTKLQILGQHNSQYKYVIAHEFGHAISALNMGTPFFNFVKDNLQPDSHTNRDRCSCDFVVSGNKTHCINSKERQGFAINEGFAHFLASRSFNNIAQSDCSFAYYKTMLQFSGSSPAIYAPPTPIACNGTIRWLDTRCPAAGGYDEQGNEWDWMTFFYDASNPNIPGTITMQELYKSFRLACTGNDSIRCAGHNVLFNHQPLTPFGNTPHEPLVVGACDTVTPGGVCTFSDARYLQFLSTGQAHGLDH
jgi:hypothetical protein